MRLIKIKNFFIGKGEPLSVIMGPCVIESEEGAFSTAEALKSLCASLNVNFIYKSSYDKANRSSHHSFRGPGIQEGLRILNRIRRELNIPVLTDVHTPSEVERAAEACDIIQIPSLLSRQTDLLIAAGKSGAVINIKKGQFMAPWEMNQVVEKIVATGNDQILLTERGTSFGYNYLINDMRAIPILQQLQFPVCFDASHSIQLPGKHKIFSGGEKEFTPILARAAVAAGCDCLYIETHPDPEKAQSDKESVYPLEGLTPLLEKVQLIRNLINV